MARNTSVKTPDYESAACSIDRVACSGAQTERDVANRREVKRRKLEEASYTCVCSNFRGIK